MTFHIDFLFGLLLTAGVYCIVPLAVASLCKTSIRKKKYIIICVVSEAVIAFAFQYWRTSTDVSGSSFWPAILWGIVFYNAGISILRKRNRLSDSTPPKRTAQSPVESFSPAPQPPIPEAASSSAPQEAASVLLTPPPITETWYTCPACGCLNHSASPCDCGYDPQRVVALTKRRKHRPTKAVIVLTVVLLTSLAGNIAQEMSYSNCRAALLEAQENNASSRTSISNLSSTVRSLQDELDSLSLYAANGCVVPVDSRMYHRDPTCSKCDLSAGYWIFNTELALSEGYKACSFCSIVKMPVLKN